MPFTASSSPESRLPFSLASTNKLPLVGTDLSVYVSSVPESSLSFAANRLLVITFESPSLTVNPVFILTEGGSFTALTE